MITVAGFNAAIDTCADAVAIRAGEVIRLSRVERYPGGKGVHVAQTCAMLGASARVVGLIDEAHGAWFQRVLQTRGVELRGVPFDGRDGRVRTCYAIRDAHGTITELLEPGPTIDPPTIAQLERAFVDACEDSEVAVLSGSLPDGCPSDLYARLVERIRDRVRHVIVDTSGCPLEEAIAATPTLVKPNRDEAARLLGRRILGTADALDAARAIAARGIRRIVISLGEDGAVVSWDDRLARVEVPRQDVASAVGSGDCFVGGLAVALSRGEDADAALRLGAACGAANVRTREPGWCDRADVERIREGVRVTWI
jgi:1-phosphofructokinase family hexose kinase